MASFAQVTATGHLVDKPFFKPADGTKGAYARCRILHNPYGKTAEGTDLPPVSIDISLYGRNAEVANQYCDKGTPVLVVGNLQTNAIAKDKEGKLVQTKAGEYIVNLNISANTFNLLGSKADNPATANAESKKAATASVPATFGAVDLF